MGDILFGMLIKKEKMKNCWKDLNVKEKIAIITAIAAFIAGWGLTIAGFIVPPVGEVAESTLWILGQALVYASSVFGITGYFSSEATKLRLDIDRFQRNIDKKIEILEEDETEQ